MSNSQPSDSTPFDDALHLQAQRESATDVTEQEMADRLTAARLLGQIDDEEETIISPPAPVGDWGAFGRGFAVGMMSNVLLGFLVLALVRAGINVYGPGLLAMTAAGLLLTLVVGSWTRLVAFALIGVIVGLVTTYAAFWVFIGPLLPTGPTPSSPSISAPGDVAVSNEASS